MLIECRIDKASRTLAALDALLVDTGHERSEDGRRSAGAAGKPVLAADVGGNVIAICCYIRDTAAIAIVDTVAIVVLAIVVVRIRWVVLLE